MPYQLSKAFHKFNQERKGAGGFCPEGSSFVCPLTYDYLKSPTKTLFNKELAS
jgi:hypothetical protein